MRTTTKCQCGRPAVDEYRNPNDGGAWTAGCGQWPFCQEPEPRTFLCMGCRDVEHPAIPGDDDSTWCECGRRLDQQRERLGL